MTGKAAIRSPKPELRKRRTCGDAGPVPARSEVHVDIDRLVVEGLPLAPADATVFQAALEQELGRLCATTPAHAWSTQALARLEARAIQLSPEGDPPAWGRQVARALFAVLQPGPKRRTSTAGERAERSFLPSRMN